MSAHLPAASQTDQPGVMMQTLTDSAVIFTRQLRPLLRSPMTLVFGVLSPLVYLGLFGPLLGTLPGAQGESSWEWFVPGILVLLAMFTCLYAGFAIFGELRSGAHERMLATPIRRTALLLGRVGTDVAVLLLQALLILGVMLPVGLRVDAWGTLLGLLLLLVLGVGLSALSYALAITVQQEYAFAPLLGAVTLPLLLLGGVLLPMDMAPDWLYVLSRVNPITHVVEAERALLAGSLTDASVPLGFACAVGLAVLALVWGARLLRHP